MINKYLIFLPETAGKVTEEFVQCLKQVTVSAPEGYIPVKLNVFIDLNDYPEYLKVSHEIRNLIISHFGDNCPAFNITVHPPEKPLKVAIEAGYMNRTDCEIIFKSHHSIHYIVRLTDATKEVWAGGLGAALFPGDTRKAAEAAFDQMRTILFAEKMSFDHIVRQWNYIGNILEIKNEIQNYQTFNEVRSENYHRYRNVHSYPSATGIGMKYGGVVLDFCAVKALNNLNIIAIDNPDQIRPYDYGQKVLKGKTVGTKRIKQPPQFERALFLGNDLNSTLFVSGTASIVGQDTIGINDVERQTAVTIDNISKLTDNERIRHLTGDTNANAGTMIMLRVYVKKQGDFPKVKTICDQRFPGVPAIYIEADICRDNLLVEIEAEYLKKHVNGFVI